MLKRSFSILELIFVLVLVVIILTYTIPKNNQHSNLKAAVDNITMHLNYTRYVAHIDNKEDINDKQWQMKLWTLKFQRCSSDVGGLYYVVYSDMSGNTAAFKKTETLKDPLTNKYMYSNSDCVVSDDESKYILITQEYGIEDVDVSCNTTSAIGQISFGYDGKIYSQLSSNIDNIKEITSPCKIRVYDKDRSFEEIVIESGTGYVH
jgi:Tfp pilus assembly protein FimT